MEGMTIEEGINQVFNGGGHVVILGAGASIASSFRNNEKNGKRLPSMDNFSDIVGLHDLIEKVPNTLRASNFEKLFGNLHNDDPSYSILAEIEQRIKEYFGNMTLPDEPTIYDYLVLSLSSTLAFWIRRTRTHRMGSEYTQVTKREFLCPLSPMSSCQ